MSLSNPACQTSHQQFIRPINFAVKCFTKVKRMQLMIYIEFFSKIKELLSAGGGEPWPKIATKNLHILAVSMVEVVA